MSSFSRRFHVKITPPVVRLTSLEVDRLELERYDKALRQLSELKGKYDLGDAIRRVELLRYSKEDVKLDGVQSDKERLDELEGVAHFAGISGVYDEENSLGNVYPDVSKLRIKIEEILHPRKTRGH